MKNYILATVAAVLVVTGAAQAQTTRTWNGGSGSWHAPGNWTPTGLPGSSDTAVINSGTVELSSAVVVANVTINGGTLTHLRGVMGGLDMTLSGTLRVEAGGSIDVTRRGLRGAFQGYYVLFGSGYPTYAGEGYDANGVPGPVVTNGASHGTLSAFNGYPTQPLYDSTTDPSMFGSGGAARNSGDNAGYGGNGGGLVRITARDMVVNGTIKADGGPGHNGASGGNSSGGGSGGSVNLLLTGGTFSGAGAITVTGGDGNSGGSAGGCGRIAAVGYSTNTFGGISGCGTLYLNARPVMPMQADLFVCELTSLIISNSAMDSDLTNTLSYAFLSAPAGAAISAEGVIAWTAPAGDGPTTNTFITVVTDNGQRALSFTNTFTVVVNRVNVVPGFVLPFAREGTLYSASVAGAFCGSPIQFSLAGGVLPNGVALNSGGQLEGRPLESGEFPMAITGRDGGNRSATTQLTLYVLPGPPEFTRLPVGVSVAPGATIWLAAETRTPAALQWSFNGLDLPDQTNSFLMFANVSSAQAGTYRVRASKDGFTIFSPDVLVQVRAPVTPPGGVRIGGGDVAQRTSGAMELRIRTLPGRAYSVERALDINAALNGGWRVVAQFTGDGGVRSFVDLEADRNPSAFFRIAETAPNPAAPWSLTDSTRFVGLAQNGVPQPGLLPFQDTNTGLFGPFDLKVAGNELPEGAGLIIRFPNGAQPVEANGQIVLRARDIDVLFGPDSFLQFAGGDNGVHHIHSATDLDVPAGPVDMRLLERLLSRPVSNGVEVVCFRAFHLQLLEGVFDSNRIRNVQLSFLGRNGVPLALALPGRSGGFANFHLDLNGRRLRIPFHGDFPLPDGTGTPPVLRVPAQRPLWLELRSDNTIALGGSGVVDIPNGPRFATEFSFDDPDYALRFSASRVEVPPLLGALDLLPRPPVVPANATPETLNGLAEQLECVSRATLNFSALTVGDATDPGAPLPNTPALAIGLAPLLEFWTCVAEHGMRPETAAAIRAAADQAARDAESSDDLLQISMTLEQNVRLRYSGGGQAEYQDAVNRAVAASKRVWRDVNCSTLDPTKLMASATNVLRTDAFLQGKGQSIDTELLNLTIALVRCSATAYCSRLGVTAGQFTAAPDSTIGRMPRLETLQHLRQLLTYHATAQALGDAPDHLGAPMREAISQLARRLWTEIETKLNSAIAANDRRAFLLLGEQTLDLLALIQTGILDDVSGLPTRAVIEAQFNAAFLTSDDAEVTGDIFNRRFDQLRDDFQRTRQMLDALPSNVQTPPPGLERRHAKLGERLVQVVPQLTVESSFTLPDLLAVMERGLAYEELRLRLNRGGQNIWRTENRFTLTVTHLRNRAVLANDWSMLHLAAQAALKQAARAELFRAAAAPTQEEPWRSFRRDCLIEAARLLESAHTVGAGLWLAAEARRTSNPALALAGMALPQGFRIDRATGELRYNSATRRLRGAFRGSLVVPKVHGTFEVLNGSFDTGGTFDLSAWGAVTLPGEEGLISITVPKRRPLHVARKLDGQISLEGAAQARLRNGITFDGFVSLADPIYRLGASVGGLRFEMATNFTGLVQLPTAERLAALPAAARVIAASYFTRLGNTLDPLTSLTDAQRESRVHPVQSECGSAGVSCRCR